jgi:plastocyanin
MDMLGKHIRIRLSVAVLCTAALFAASAGKVTHAQNTSAKQVEVKIDNFTFDPQTLTVASGTTVKWTNRDDIPHTVVSEDKTTFKSKALDTDESFSYTFSKPGTYTYFCSIHPKMVAKVVVQER